MDIFQDNIFRDLEKLNFSINESKVYLTLLRIGPSMAGKLAKEAQLDRSSTYNALKLLQQRGIISVIHETKRTTYVPENPKKILDYLQEKEEIGKKVVMNLQDKFSAKKIHSGDVRLFQGYKGIKTIFQDILDSCDENSTYYVIGSEGQLTEKMPYYSPILRKRKEDKKIKTKMLVREGREKEIKTKYTEYRRVPSDVVSEATINIYEGKVAIFIWGDTPQGILINNSSVSRTFENYFNFMWKHAKKD